MEVDTRRLVDLIQQQANAHSRPRFLVALAGIPGSGKTTVAQALVRELNSSGNAMAALLSMDGFHLTQEELRRSPDPAAAFVRRGAPWTFDTQDAIKAPGFDHEGKDPVEDKVIVTPDTQIVIFEGNYLLLDEPQWRGLIDLFDYSVFLDVDPAQVREQLAKRHIEAGIEQTLQDAFKRIDKNDFLNAIIVQENLLKPDLVIQWSGNMEDGTQPTIVEKIKP
ncbi:P-loop containing nucleoside triphosphate hydrolase protein [Aspergillus steynii IBT 23096]|uniref:P-loop containing nucleoside triphosphate hydrolase protein n=1 Tax=Aspergillus steynii IBT 23096 TaxID=1392250 RepID=A0A2I2G702_9EURO|nr:P-loop containing nucleoside triphosphate hydrolase protein [Aspergillus steynii IBT 23096]PLB48653.1 P-loop containing nucleoside triphosphate hydrolase protein [Aspergillus steynii IBT 23096]